MTQHRALRSLAWAVSITSLFVLTLGAVLVSMVVGFWVYDNTFSQPLSWVVGITIMVGFLASMGVGVGVWLWLRGPLLPEEEDTMTKVLDDMSSRIPKD